MLLLSVRRVLILYKIVVCKLRILMQRTQSEHGMLDRGLCMHKL